MSATNQSAVRRVLHLLFVLQGHTLEGLRLKQIADAIKTTPSTALRDLEVLADEGIAERIPGRDEYWRLSPRLIQLARAHEQEIARHRQRLEETEQRYSRNPN
ncbi:MAG: helix-turn-helix domain-containing protein [Stenotrophomonas sp.]|uniref:helix-turn-helix domain-containing protein n=1 Tax=Stenotrophomonas sp. TaxID=69392 RepID=UPI003D6CD037